MRPRIRTLKPEIWADEKVADLSHGARLLYVGLITMADDEGRIRELPAAINGHVFPDDALPARKLTRWLNEISVAGLIVRYEANGKRYLAFRKWKKHQRVDKPNGSELPPPPEDSQNGSQINLGSDRGSVSEPIADQSRPPRARASLPIPSDPDPSSKEGKESRPRSQRRRLDQTVPPDDFPADQLPVLEHVVTVLHEAWDVRGGVEPQERGVGMGMLRNARADHGRIADELRHWLLAGRGQRAKCADIAKRFGDWVADAEAADRGGSLVPLQRSEAVQHADRYLKYYDQGKAS